MMLSDGPTDKLHWRKKVLGEVNSSNLTFKTFEPRRTSPFVSANHNPVGVFNVPAATDNVTQVTVSAEDLESGEFTLSVAPASGDNIIATYYNQWFNDAEIQQFLTTATEWIQGSDDWTQLPNQLWPAAKTYAAATGYQKLVSKFATNLAETFQLYDAPDKQRFNPITAYTNQAKVLFALAFELRDDVYKNRQGRALAPSSQVIRGRIKDVPPNR
jgi:hypothetical protein